MSTHYIEVHGEPMTGLKFDRAGKAEVMTGNMENVIRYTADEAAECVASIGSGAEAVELGKFTLSNTFETLGYPTTERFATRPAAEAEARRFALDMVDLVGTVSAGRVTIAGTPKAKTGFAGECEWWNNLRDAAGASWDAETETGTDGSLSVDEVVERLLDGPVCIEEVEAA